MSQTKTPLHRLPAAAGLALLMTFSNSLASAEDKVNPGSKDYVTPLPPVQSTPEPEPKPRPTPRTPREVPVINNSNPAPRTVEPGATISPRKTPKKVEPFVFDGEPWVVTADHLNVRLNAGTGNPMIDRLRRGDHVYPAKETALSNGEKWMEVQFAKNNRTGSGWVSADYISERDEADLFGRFASLNYEPVEKKSYPDNPRVHARGIYVSIQALASEERFNQLLELTATTRINTWVIDYKDDVGWLLQKSATAERLNPEANRKARYQDISELIQKLKARDIYLIARLVTFKDPSFARAHPEKTILNNRNRQVFKSSDGLTWASPHDEDFRAYNIGIAREAAAAGFNEVQFDYVRFPDVPRSADLNYRNTRDESKAMAIQSFLLEARAVLAPMQVYVAADVFGFICTAVDDMRIGQYWEAISNAVDYICPMMYPSHYGPNVYGLKVPDQHPYETIYRGLNDAQRRNSNIQTPAELRPWLQGFTATWVRGYRKYETEEMKEQIRALSDHGIDSWFIWNPAVYYNPESYR